jgi:uncharacterized C2H2 Zn-finger protein
MAEKKSQDMAGKKALHCPYCDNEVLEAKLPWCQACGVKLLSCPQCGQSVGREMLTCPHCGVKISSK